MKCPNMLFETTQTQHEIMETEIRDWIGMENHPWMKWTRDNSTIIPEKALKLKGSRLVARKDQNCSRGKTTRDGLHKLQITS
jgi:hypothetical protein